MAPLLSQMKALVLTSMIVGGFSQQRSCSYAIRTNVNTNQPGELFGTVVNDWGQAHSMASTRCSQSPTCRGYAARRNTNDSIIMVWGLDVLPFNYMFLSNMDENNVLAQVSVCNCEVDRYWALSVLACQPCSGCSAGFTGVSGTCTGQWDRQCRPCVQPTAGQYVAATCTSQTDTTRLPCRVTCPANTYKTRDCINGTATVLGSDTQCTACTAVCGTNQYITQNCTRLTNAVCGNCSSCGPLGEQYISRDCRPSETRDRECTDCARCDTGTFTNRTCTATTTSTCTSCEAQRYGTLAAYETRLATHRDEEDDLPTHGILCGDGSGLPARVANTTGRELVLYGTDVQRTVNSTCWNGTTLRIGGWNPDLRIVAADALHRSVCYNCWVASRVLTPLFVIAPKFDRSNRLMAFQCVPGYQALVLPTQPRNGTADTGIGVYTKKCYSSGGDNVTVADSVLNGAAPLLCKCRDIPGAHNCSSDTTQEKWIMDGADSFTRHTYVHNRWVFDPTNPENRGQILVSFQPYMRMIDGGIEEFYLSDTLSDLPNGRLVFLADNLALGMTILVRTTGNSVIRLDQDVDLWFGSAAALSTKNPDATTAAAITMGTDSFYFDMRFHRMNGLTRDLATGARKAYFDSISRIVNDIRPNEFTPAWGVRLEWLYASSAGTSTGSASGTASASASSAGTSTGSASASASASASSAGTSTGSASGTASASASSAATSTCTATGMGSSIATRTSRATLTATATSSNTPSNTPTPSVSASPGASSSPSPSGSPMPPATLDVPPLIPVIRSATFAGDSPETINLGLILRMTVASAAGIENADNVFINATIDRATGVITFYSQTDPINTARSGNDRGNAGGKGSASKAKKSTSEGFPPSSAAQYYARSLQGTGNTGTTVIMRVVIPPVEVSSDPGDGSSVAAQQLAEVQGIADALSSLTSSPSNGTSESGGDSGGASAPMSFFQTIAAAVSEVTGQAAELFLPTIDASSMVVQVAAPRASALPTPSRSVSPLVALGSSGSESPFPVSLVAGAAAGVVLLLLGTALAVHYKKMRRARAIVAIAPPEAEADTKLDAASSIVAGSSSTEAQAPFRSAEQQPQPMQEPVHG